MPDQVDPGMLRPAIERRLRKKIPGVNGKPTLGDSAQMGPGKAASRQKIPGQSAGDMIKKTIANKKKAYPGLK